MNEMVHKKVLVSCEYERDANAWKKRLSEMGMKITVRKVKGLKGEGLFEFQRYPHYVVMQR